MGKVLATAGAALLALIVLPIALLLVVFAPAGGSNPSAQALADIPADLLPIYMSAANRCGMDWSVLAAIGKIETDHGRSSLPGVSNGENYAGAGGPMQFLAATWAAYGVDGDGDGRADRYSPVDSVHGAANYLCANGAGDPARLERAIWRYNHLDSYVRAVLAQAALYRDAAAAAAAAPTAGVPAGAQLMTADTAKGPVTLARDPRVGWVNVQIAGNVAALLDAANASGLGMGGWAFRSNAEQIRLREAHCGSSAYAIYEMPSSSCSPPTARPGQSMHELGLAVDFTCGGGGSIGRSSPCFTWLAGNAGRFGLRNLASEPWHWSSTGG